MLSEKLKRLVAMVLSLILVSALFTDALPAALAAGTGGGASTPATFAAAKPGGGDKGDFYDADNGLPNLYVDFLGDNWYYDADYTVRPLGIPGGAPAPTALKAPGTYDQSAVTNPSNGANDATDTHNVWEGYKSFDYCGSIFWVGVGVDRTEVLKLLEGDKGLTSLELSFFYNKHYIEPYTGPGNDFKAVITDANIVANPGTGDNLHWSDKYEILHAEPELDVDMELVTQERVIDRPTLDDIQNNTPLTAGATDVDWKMTYISLELKNIPDVQRLSAGTGYSFNSDYFKKNGDGDPDPVGGKAPDAAYGTEVVPEYLLLIPFKLVSYDSLRNLCLRLNRNATHFSIGGGTDGTEPYAAWERVTTRNPGKDIKLMTRFTGDLNIFTGDKVQDVHSEAILKIVNGGSAQNKAKLTVDGDPSVYPVYADATGQSITGLKGGIGMFVHTETQTGYSVSVTVYEGGVEPTAPNVGNIISHVTLPSGKDFTFIMPDEKDVPTVLVVVRFENENRDSYDIYLSELPLNTNARDMANNNVEITDGATTGTVVYVKSGDVPVKHPSHVPANAVHDDGPVGAVPKAKKVVVNVSTHSDYTAKVRVYNFANEEWSKSGFTVVGGPNTPDTNGYMYLEYGGSISFDMPLSDLDVEVTYELADRYKAHLMVTHAANTDIDADNTAQLGYLYYNAQDVGAMAYSGQVYDKAPEYEADNVTIKTPEDPRAVKDPGIVIQWVPMSAAALSKSLGGDTGETGRPWLVPNDKDTGRTAIMSLLYSRSSAADLAAALNGLDFSSLQITNKGTNDLIGMRKNLDGEFFGDFASKSDITAIAEVLWELRDMILADTSTGGLAETYVKEVPDPDNPGGVLYTYFDLTPAQVQAYIMEIQEAEQIYRDNMDEYQYLYEEWLKVKVIYDRAEGDTLTAGATPLERPVPPTKLSATAPRSYSGTDYKSSYAASYKEYLFGTSNNGYKAYITDVANGATLPSVAFTDTPDSLPALVDLEIMDAASAEDKVYNGTWGSDIRGNAARYNGTNYIETREGRTVWIALEANSAYEVDEIKLYDLDNNGEPNNEVVNAIVTPTAYVNVYSFTMPNYDCIVNVTYKKRDTAKLEWKVLGADGNNDNLTSFVAFRVNTAPTAAVPVTRPDRAERTNDGNQSVDPYVGTPVEDVFQESTVTVTVKKASGYTVSVVAFNRNNGGTISVTGPTAGVNGDIYTFVMEKNCTLVELIVTYEPEGVPKNNAYITFEEVDVNTSLAFVNNAVWDTGGTTQTDVPAGTVLNGKVTIAPGYYIHAVTATGPSGDYVFTLGGNGYNNGNGTYVKQADGTYVDVPVDILVVMPREELTVHVVIKKGPPPVAPATALSLRVVDNANTDTTNPADNWASLSVEHTNPDGTTSNTLNLGKLGKGTSGNNKLADSGYAEVGDVVTVDYSCVVKTITTASGTTIDQSNSYYVSSITVGPETLGVQLNWLPGNKVQFVMPTGSLGVTVTFKKGIAPTYSLHAYRLENGYMKTTFLPSSTSTATVQREGNQVSSVQSETVKSFMGATDMYRLKQTNEEDDVLNPGTKIYTPINPETAPNTDDYSNTGIAKAGEMVRVNFQCEDGWYVQGVERISDSSVWNIPFTSSTDPDAPGIHILTGDNSGTGNTTFQAIFYMPASDVDFYVHYRKGPKPTTPEHSMTLRVFDRDNVEIPATSTEVAFNWVQGYVTRAVDSSVTDPSPASSAPKLGAFTNVLRDVRYAQAGDTVTLEYMVQPGFIMDYIIVTPKALRIYPQYSVLETVTDSYTDLKGNPVTNTAVHGVVSFTMPAENITVVANIVKAPENKKEPRKYTANLIIRRPAGVPDSVPTDEIALASFLQYRDAAGTTTVGSLNDPVYWVLLEAGSTVDLEAFAMDGYYIRAVTIDPQMGTSCSLSGSFSDQFGQFVMPATNVNVNVWIERGYPDEVKYTLNLKVIDPSFDLAAYTADVGATPGNEANYNSVSFRSAGGVPFTGADGEPVHGNQSKTIPAAAYDRNEVILDIHRTPGYYVNANKIVITDSAGNVIPWRYVAGGIAFTMPPRTTYITVTFLPDSAVPEPVYEVRLHTTDLDATDAARLELDADPANKNVVAVAAAGYATQGAITQLHAGDTLTLTATPGTDRYIRAAFAVDSAGRQIMLPITLPREGTDTASGTPVGAFAMPQSDADVYVIYAAAVPGPGPGTDPPGDQVVNLIVSGDPAVIANNANVAITRSADGSAGGNITVAGNGAASTPADINDTATVTVNVDPGWYISSLSVTNRAGVELPITWITMLEDVTPEPSVWYPNPLRQFTFTVPSGGATVHVTYARNTDLNKIYTAQVVVNKGTAATVTNDAWLRKSGVGDMVQAKLKQAKAGEWIDLDVIVQAGYMIEYIRVIPQEFGIVPALYLTPMDSQSTGFYMPAGNVTVYVKFTTDTLTRYTARLVVAGAVNPANIASIHSDYSGTAGPITPGDAPVFVVAAPDREFITVDYSWYLGDSLAAPPIPAHSIRSVTVRDQSGNDVPFTQVDAYRITFPMIARNVTVTVTFKDDPLPVAYPVVLHVIDKTGKPITSDTEGYGRVDYYKQDGVGNYLDAAGNRMVLTPKGLLYTNGAGKYWGYDGVSGPSSVESNLEGFELDVNGDPTTTPCQYVPRSMLVPLDTTNNVIAQPRPGNLATIYIPAGQWADLSAFSSYGFNMGDDQFYIESGYVLYEAGGQMLRCDFQPNTTAPMPGFTGLKDARFAVHPGRNDVYVTITKEPPVSGGDEYAAVLMIKGAADDVNSVASICVGNDYNSTTRRDSVRINDPNKSHAYVTAKRVGNTEETITVSVFPASGYAIDYILMTPLGDPTNPTIIRAGNTFHFNMPSHNVAVTVYLKQAVDTKYTATLHFLQLGTALSSGYDPVTGTVLSTSDFRANRAEMSWEPDGATSPTVERAYAETEATVGAPTMEVEPNKTVSVGVTLDDPYVVLAAFVLQGSELVRTFGPPMEGVVEGLSFDTGTGTQDNTKLDATASFQIQGDSDIYVVVTDDPPANPDWHTAVLVVTDRRTEGGVTYINQGENSSTIEEATMGVSKTAKTGNRVSPTQVDPKMGVEFITVWEGQKVDTTVWPPSSNKYQFAPSQISIRHTDPTASEDNDTPTGLSQTQSNPYMFRYTVGNYNSSVHVHFGPKDGDSKPLTVVIEDDDNPGGGSVVNQVKVTPDSMTPLVLRSVTSAGAYQVIPGVDEGKNVQIVATPQIVRDSGGTELYTYCAYATYEDDLGTTTTTITPFTRAVAADGTVTYTGNITMPAAAAKVTVHFYRGYTGTLTMVNMDTTDPTTQASMTEDFTNNTVIAHNVWPTSSISKLPHKTWLTANITALQAGSKVTAVLLTTPTGAPYSTWLLSPTQADGSPLIGSEGETDKFYRHRINRADAEITFVIDNETTGEHTHVAAVRTVNMPAGTTRPTIVSNPAGSMTGTIWTTSDQGNTVTLTLEVPAHYKAVVTAVQQTGPTVMLDDGTGSSTTVATRTFTTAGTGQTVFFEMPDDNVQVTVTYIKTDVSLTLRIVDNNGYSNGVTVTPSAVLSGTSPLTADGDSVMVDSAAGVTVDVKALLAPDPGDPTRTKGRITGIYWKEAGGSTYWLSGATMADYDPAGDEFTMGNRDVTVWVIYDARRDPDGPDPDPDEFFIASTARVDPDDMPGNQVLAIWNETSTTVPAALWTPGSSSLPESSPDWTAGRRTDEIKVSFTTEPGYFAVVTARTATPLGGGYAVYVVQQGSTGTGLASIRMPGDDVTITVTFYKDGEPLPPDVPDPTKPEDVTLRLHGHGTEQANEGKLMGGTWETIPVDFILNGKDAITAAGVAAPGPYDIQVEITGDATSPVFQVKKDAKTGDKLVISADQGAGYLVDRITVSVPDGSGGTIETSLPLNRYGSNASARLYMPGEGAVVTVYYVNIYTATLHIVGATAGDQTSMTDDRTNTVTSTGTDPIDQTGDKLIELRGGTPSDPGEQIQTTAIPDETATPKQILVGVVYESNKTGAGPTVPYDDGSGNPTHRYDFYMPQADTDVYAFYEAESDNRSYIAKVAIDQDSVDFYKGNNTVSIRNVTDTSAPKGTYWTAAKAGQTVTITVNLEPGYQALVTSTKKDAAPTAAPFDFYVSRTSFVVSGKTTTFSMPENTDATVTIKYIKGYDLTLEVVDSAPAAAHPNKALVEAKVDPWAATPDIRTIEGDNPSAGVVNYTPAGATQAGLPISGFDVDTTLDPLAAGIDARVFYQTAFQGTVAVPMSAAAAGLAGTYLMPNENTLESVLLRDENAPDNLLAKVELKGESDINGNGVPKTNGIVDKDTPAPATTTGTIWTTTDGDHLIDVSFRVAKGYIAKIKVRIDDAAMDPNNPATWRYLDPLAYHFTLITTSADDPAPGVTKVIAQTDIQDDGWSIIQGFSEGSRTDPPDGLQEVLMNPSISDVQHFRFNMPEDRAAGTNSNPATAAPGDEGYDYGDVENDVTVIIEYIYLSDIPAPFDPDNKERSTTATPTPQTEDLKEGFIYAENHRTYAIVNIPTLEQDKKLFDTDKYENSKIIFRFYVYDAATDVYTELRNGTDVELWPVDPGNLKNAGDPYNYYDYTTPASWPETTCVGITLTGSLFGLSLLPPPSGGTMTAAALALKGMLDNAGSIDPATHKTRLYVLAENEVGEQSAYTEVWLRPAYTVTIPVISYGPRHSIESNLYPLKDGLAPGDELFFENYETTPTTTEFTPVIPGQDKWFQVVEISSSELLGGYDDPVTATTYALTLDKAANITYTRVDLELDIAAAYYTAADKIFQIPDTVTLIAGDVDGDGRTKWADYELLRRFVDRSWPWTTAANDQAAGWSTSVLNPDTLQYRCDLNSDGVISQADLDVITTTGHYNRTAADYLWDEGGPVKVLPHGFSKPNTTVSFFSATAAGTEARPVPLDPIDDAQVIPPELLVERGELPPEALEDYPAESPVHDERPETPVFDREETPEQPMPEDERPIIVRVTPAIPNEPEQPARPEPKPDPEGGKPDGKPEDSEGGPDPEEDDERPETPEG